jgi:hypothetical protein
VPGVPIRQLLTGVAAALIPIDDDAVVIGDNADLYGTIADLEART